MSVPDSGNVAALGYSHASGIPYVEGLLKNKYMGRTFIQPGQKQRERAVRMKLNPIVMNVKGKRIILVDDSIVRGTTSGIIIRLLRNAGAKEIKCASVRLLSDSLVSSALIRHSGGSWSPRAIRKKKSAK